ncbi:sialyltransferase-like protein [Trifolium pratense]|uniref:Sialyltransferase-like protein n=1 Tax=Trifolium pratense TaxID=57577 RepID=A0A2K3MLS2_TRIPR|nr:sialyltransferase-like protein [Trifolium pratense]
MRVLRLGLLLALASGFAAICIYITGLSDPSVYRSYHLTDEEAESLLSLHDSFQKCVALNHLVLGSIPDWCVRTGKTFVGRG